MSRIQPPSNDAGSWQLGNITFPVSVPEAAGHQILSAGSIDDQNAACAADISTQGAMARPPIVKGQGIDSPRVHGSDVLSIKDIEELMDAAEGPHAFTATFGNALLSEGNIFTIIATVAGFVLEGSEVKFIIEQGDDSIALAARACDMHGIIGQGTLVHVDVVIQPDVYQSRIRVLQVTPRRTRTVTQHFRIGSEDGLAEPVTPPEQDNNVWTVTHPGAFFAEVGFGYVHRIHVTGAIVIEAVLDGNRRYARSRTMTFPIGEAEGSHNDLLVIVGTLVEVIEGAKASTYIIQDATGTTRWHIENNCMVTDISVGDYMFIDFAIHIARDVPVLVAAAGTAGIHAFQDHIRSVAARDRPRRTTARGNGPIVQVDSADIRKLQEELRGPGTFTAVVNGRSVNQLTMFTVVGRLDYHMVKYDDHFVGIADAVGMFYCAVEEEAVRLPLPQYCFVHLDFTFSVTGSTASLNPELLARSDADFATTVLGLGDYLQDQQLDDNAAYLLRCAQCNAAVDQTIAGRYGRAPLCVLCEEIAEVMEQVVDLPLTASERARIAAVVADASSQLRARRAAGAAARRISWVWLFIIWCCIHSVSAMQSDGASTTVLPADVQHFQGQTTQRRADSRSQPPSADPPTRLSLKSLGRALWAAAKGANGQYEVGRHQLYIHEVCEVCANVVTIHVDAHDVVVIRVTDTQGCAPLVFHVRKADITGVFDYILPQHPIVVQFSLNGDRPHPVLTFSARRAYLYEITEHEQTACEVKFTADVAAAAARQAELRALAAPAAGSEAPDTAPDAPTTRAHQPDIDDEDLSLIRDAEQNEALADILPTVIFDIHGPYDLPRRSYRTASFAPVQLMLKAMANKMQIDDPRLALRLAMDNALVASGALMCDTVVASFQDFQVLTEGVDPQDTPRALRPISGRIIGANLAAIVTVQISGPMRVPKRLIEYPSVWLVADMLADISRRLSLDDYWLTGLTRQVSRAFWYLPLERHTRLLDLPNSLIVIEAQRVR